MHYYTTSNPDTGDCFLICFVIRDMEDRQPSPEVEEDIVALVQLKGDEIVWHKKGTDGDNYHFNEYLMKQDLLMYKKLDEEGWVFEVPFPCIANDSEVTYSWSTP
ncbi:TPA: hypothetical protein P7P90_004338 [Salmonella enterica]|nr:hypothetical protein [Salmonella enterica]